MSEITDRIVDYREGRMTSDELVEWMRNHDFPTPSRFLQPKPVPFKDQGDVHENLVDAQIRPEFGTWDEVVWQYDMGRLTSDEFYAIHEAVVPERSPKAPEDSLFSRVPMKEEREQTP